MGRRRGLKTLRRMTSAELAEYFKIPRNTAIDLKRAINPNYFDILSNNNLTALEMAQKSGLSLPSVNDCRHSLVKTKIVDRKVPRVPYSQSYELILSSLTHPMSCKELQREIGYNYHRTSTFVTNLTRQGKIQVFRLTKHPDLFGKLSNKTYIFKPEQKDAAIRLILEHLPPLEEILSKKLSNRLTTRLRRSNLSAEIFKAVHSYYVAKEEDIPPKRTKSPADASLFLLNRFNKIAKDFGLEAKTPEELAAWTKILSDYGLFEHDAYKLKRTKFQHPETGEIEEGLELILNLSAKFNPNGPHYICSLLHSDVLLLRKHSHLRGKYQYKVLLALKNENKPIRTAKVAKLLGVSYGTARQALNALTLKHLVEDSDGIYTIGEAGLEQVANYERENKV